MYRNFKSENLEAGESKNNKEKNKITIHTNMLTDSNVMIMFRIYTVYQIKKRGRCVLQPARARIFVVAVCFCTSTVWPSWMPEVVGSTVVAVWEDR